MEDGAQMKINKSDIKDAIISALNEQEEEASLAATDKTKFQRKSMAASTFAKAGKEQRKEANPELTNLEKGIVDQISKFLLNLAEMPGVDLNAKRTVLQRVFNMLKKRIGAEDAAQQQAIAEACGPSIAPAMPMDSASVGDHGDGHMAKSQLYRAAEYATELEQMIEDGEELDAWVQAKITKASDYLSSVKHYLEYKKIRGDQ